jgi:hypothetical protein
VARNKFKAALNHIKSTDVDEKIQRLNEAPTNNTSGVYDLSPRGQRYGELSPEKTFYANLDGSWPPGVPGTPGERTYVRPRGYWEEGPGTTPSVQHDEIVELDFSYDTQIDDPRNTKTLIDETTGRVKTELPPNSRSFILGPLVDMFHYNHGYDSRTFVGYIQKDTREFVLLGSIPRTWGNDNNGVPIRADGYEGSTGVWDGTDSSFVSYNPNFTFEMLQWHHERLKEGKYVKNVSFFHSGGVPIIQGAGGTGQPAGTNQGNVSGTPGPGDAGNNGDADQTHGSGGNPDIGTPQSEPVSGDAVEAGFPWDLINKFVEKGENAFDALMNMTPGQKAELAMTALNIGLDIAAVAGIIFPEPGTTAAGLARMATRLGIKAGSAAMKGARAARGAAGLATKLGGSKGLARGLRGAQVGATGVKKAGYQALKGGKNLHKGSKGLLSPGGKGVYSAPSVGKVGPGGFRPGSGAGRYVKSGSNPLGGAQGKSGQAGGVLGSITPGGSRRIGGIEPQAVVNPRTFQKGQKLFQKVQGGAYPKSPRANQLRQQAQKAGFKPGQANIPASQVPKSKSTGNPFADKYRLPANYKDKLGKAQAYFQNNLNGVGYRTLGFTEVERMDALMNKAFKKQGFTDQQIDTIKRENLLVTKYGESPSLKAKEAAAKREAEEASKEREKQQQVNLNTRSTVLNTFKNTQTSSGRRSEVRSGTNKPYMNIRVGNTSTPRSTSNLGKDYGNIAGSLTGPRNSPGPGVPRNSPRGPYTPIKNYGTDKNPNFMPSGPSQNPWRLARNRSLFAHHELQGDILSEVATPTPTVETPPVTQGARESAQQTADATANMIAQQYPKDQVAEFALDAESAAEYETTKDTNIQELLNKAPGTLTPYEEQILLDAGFDDYVRGGMRGTDLLGDLATLGLSLAAAKAILPLLMKVGGNFVNLIAHEHGMRAITDAAYKTFQQTGQMPPWYHWAFWKLLPQSTLNAFAKIAGTTPAKSILATEGTAAGKAALHTILKPAALIQFFSMLLGGDQRGAENLLNNEIRSIAEKAIETEQYDLLDSLYDEIGDDEFFKLYDVTENLLGFTERIEEINTAIDRLYDDEYNMGWEVRPGNFQDMRLKLDPRYAAIDVEYQETRNFLNKDGGVEFREAKFSTAANAPSWYKGKVTEGSYHHVAQLYWKNTGVELSSSEYDRMHGMYTGPNSIFKRHQDAISRANDRVYEYREGLFTELSEMSDQVFVEMIVDYMLMKPNTQLPNNFSYDPGQDPGDQANAYDNYDWLWKTYGIDAAEWYLENQKLPMESNPFIPAGAYLPLAKGDLTDLPQGAESTFGTRDSATIASLIGATAKRKEEEERKKRNVTASFKQSGQFISEDRKKLLREIKQPLNEVGELQPQKLKNYRPNFKGRYVPQNTPDVTASKEANDMVRAKNAAGQTWRESDKYWGGYESQERANVIYDHVGHGQIYWDEIVSHNQGKKTSRDREIQEELNKQYSLIAEKEMASIAEQETLDAPKDPLFKKVRNKLKDKIDYQDKPSKLGYPNTPPKEQEQGFHPDYGKRKGYYKKLDPHSADAMPETGDFDIDDTVEKQKSLYGLYLKQQRMQGKPNS